MVRELYAVQDDVLNGDYASLMRRFSPTGPPAADLFDQMLHASNVVPKVYLCMIEEATEPYIIALHRPARFLRHPVDQTRSDGGTYAFVGDVLPGYHIDIVDFPTDPFTRIGPHRVPTLPHMAAVEAGMAAADTVADLLPVGDRNAEEVLVRKLIQVPHRYIPLVLNVKLTPREAWTQLGGAIIADGLKAPLEPLLEWLRVAMTAGDAAGASPLLTLGDRSTALPTLAVDPALQNHRWNILRSDFPHFQTGGPDNTDRVLAFAQVVREEARRADAARAARDAAARAPKTPSEAFPLTAPLWRALAGVGDDAALPPIYQLWASSTKSERRPALQQALDVRAREPDAATINPPIASKELFEMILQGNVGMHIHQINDLSAGLSPFTCGHFIGDRGAAV